MKKKSNVIAFIPARGGSKEIPKKNIKNLAGKPLIYYTIKEAKKSRYLNRIVVSTEDNQILKISKKFGIDVIRRPKKFATDNATTEQVILHAINFIEKEEKCALDIIAILQPTSPLRRVEDIDGAIKKFQKSNCDSVVSVCHASNPPQWMYEMKNDKLIPIIKSSSKKKRRQDLPKVFQINGAIYLTRRNNIIRNRKILGKDNRGYLMPVERSIDIDSMLDFKLAEILVKNKK